MFVSLIDKYEEEIKTTCCVTDSHRQHDPTSVCEVVRVSMQDTKKAGHSS